jgi:hypothetical protein
MSSGATTTARELEAQAAAQAAADGNLPLVNEYKLQHSSDQFRIGVDPFFATNTKFGKGSVSGLYVDLQRGMLVFDFQTGDEYDPEISGVKDGEE